MKQNNTHAPCPECNGTGEVLGHADDCDDDLCALNGDMHSCTGKMEPCSTCGVMARPESGKHCRWVEGECQTCGLTAGVKVEGKGHA